MTNTNAIAYLRGGMIVCLSCSTEQDRKAAYHPRQGAVCAICAVPFVVTQNPTR